MTSKRHSLCLQKVLCRTGRIPNDWIDTELITLDTCASCGKTVTSICLSFMTFFSPPTPRSPFPTPRSPLPTPCFYPRFTAVSVSVLPSFLPLFYPRFCLICLGFSLIYPRFNGDLSWFIPDLLTFLTDSGQSLGGEPSFRLDLLGI